MDKLLSMLRDVELNNQEVYLKRLRDSGEMVGCFIPAWTVDRLQKGIETVARLWKLGINFAFVALFDEFMGNFEGVDIEVPTMPVSQIGSCEDKPRHIIMLQSGEEWTNAMYQYFMGQGICPHLLWNWEEIEGKKKYYWYNIHNIVMAYRWFEDDISREAFLGVLKGKLTGQPYDRVYAQEMQYMLQGFKPFEGSIAIDGGAFDGETGRQFADLGADVYSFELDRRNFQRVEEKARKYNFHAINKGLWSCKKQDKYHVGGEASTVTGLGTEIADLIDIDTFVNENDLPRVDYIKLDVEGGELEVLKGAAMSISKWKPILAISAYHREEDLWTLGQYIKSLRPDYEFAFRHHAIDARDYYLRKEWREIYLRYGLGLMAPTPWESVLYAR